MKYRLIILLIFVCEISGVSQGFQQFINMRVLFEPIVVTISGKPMIYYELHLTNIASTTIRLKKLEIITADTTVVATIDQENLKNRIGAIGTLSKETVKVLLTDSSSVVYIEFPLLKDKPNTKLFHRLTLEIEQQNTQKTVVVAGAEIALIHQPRLVLSAPLGAGAWAAVYEPSWERGHRRVFYTVNDKARIPGRFAIDFIKLDEQGKYAKNDENQIQNWYGYAADVLAVSDAVVVSVRDDFTESKTLSEHPRHTADKATGNYVSMDIGNGYFVFYEHLKPGSIRVKPGQKVKTGHVIASIGFTGQTTGPHLHLHVADGNSPLGAEGVPFAFERFTVLGFYPDFSKFGKQPWTSIKNSRVLTKERPAPNTVVKF